MSQHFLLSAAARSLSIGKVMRMSDQGAENIFARRRWPTTDGKPVCPDCGCTTCYDCRRGAYACIVFRQFLRRHRAFDDLARRHWSRCITQDVMDAPTTFAWTKPVVAPARWCRLKCFGLDVRIKQPHGRFEMGQIGETLIHLILKTFDRVGDLQSLVS